MRPDSGSDCDSDLDLTKELKPIGQYVHHRELMLDHMFRSISRKKLRAMLPETLKVIPNFRGHVERKISKCGRHIPIVPWLMGLLSDWHGDLGGAKPLHCLIGLRGGWAASQRIS